jgi:drug/metabolite transporter (DMT)-like permease
VYNWALRHVQVLLVSLSFLAEPPLATLLALAFFGAVPDGPTIAGGVLIIAGLALALIEPGAWTRPAPIALNG